MALQGVITRDVTCAECPWLGATADGDLHTGDIVYRYDEHTYGCITDKGIACSRVPNAHPFFEVPANAVKWKYHLRDWCAVNGRFQGKVYGHPTFADGEVIYTSLVTAVQDGVVETLNSFYILDGPPAAQRQ